MEHVGAGDANREFEQSSFQHQPVTHALDSNAHGNSQQSSHPEDVHPNQADVTTSNHPTLQAGDEEAATITELPSTASGTVGGTVVESTALPENAQISSIEQARAWRNRNRAPYLMTHPEIPEDFEANAQRHITYIYNAIVDCSRALDGPRQTGMIKRSVVPGSVAPGQATQGQTIRGSKGYRAMAANQVDSRDTVAAAWVVWDNLLDLHRHGTELRAGTDFTTTRGESDDVDLTIQERLNAVCDLLRSYKSCCLEATETNEYRIRVMVRAPKVVLRTKRLYQASNDSRKVQHTVEKPRGKRTGPQQSTTGARERAVGARPLAAGQLNQSPRFSETSAESSPQSLEMAWEDDAEEEEVDDEEEIQELNEPSKRRRT